METYSTLMTQFIFYIMRFVRALLCAPKLVKYDLSSEKSICLVVTLVTECYIAANFFEFIEENYYFLKDSRASDRARIPCHD